jgi:pimeloyl-ACP methyl ester carboxylesterase
MSSGRAPAHLLWWTLPLVLAACAMTPDASSMAPTSGAASPSTLPSPSDNPALPDAPAPIYYYPTADAVAAATPGEITRSLEIRASPGMRAWFVVYRSTGLNGKPVAVSGLILAPDRQPPAAGWPVIAWAHGTTGIEDTCAPSRAGMTAIRDEVRALVTEGNVVTATDYEGLGTDGIHPYLVGISEGRSVLDSIRAVRLLPEAHAGEEAVLIGYSQGGHAALWAAQLASTYAPELDVRGVVANSPPADLLAWETWAFESARAGNLFPSLGPLLLFGVWNSTYDLPIDFLTSLGQQAALLGRGSCLPGEFAKDPYLADPAAIEVWAKELRENSLGATQTKIPLLVVAASGDSLVQYASQLSGVAAMCSAGDALELRTVSGDHAATWSPPTWALSMSWISDRFAGVVPPSTCMS